MKLDRLKSRRGLFDLIQQLPDPGGDFPIAERLKWLRAMAAEMNVHYLPDCEIQIYGGLARSLDNEDRAP